jgi:hypothetical protein
MLLKSEIRPLIDWGTELVERSPAGHECDDLQRLLERPGSGLTVEDKEHCRKAIDALQVGFDCVLRNNKPGENRFHMLLMWCVMSPPEVMDLLERRHPEALVALAYYGLLLHHGREMWQVGDAGAYILLVVDSILGPEWDPWLAWPRSQIVNMNQPQI